MQVCVTCDEGEVSDQSRTGICPGCQSSFTYWKKKRPAQVIQRRQRLTKYQTRLDLWFNADGTRGKGKEKVHGKKSGRARNATTH